MTGLEIVEKSEPATDQSARRDLLDMDWFSLFLVLPGVESVQAPHNGRLNLPVPADSLTGSGHRSRFEGLILQTSITGMRLLEERLRPAATSKFSLTQQMHKRRRQEEEQRMWR